MSKGTLNKGSFVKGVAGGGGGGTTYTAGAGIEINNNNISVKKVVEFFNQVSVFADMTTYDADKITINSETYLSVVDADMGFNQFSYDGTNWRLWGGAVINLSDYGITLDDSITPANEDTITISSYYLTGKTEFTVDVNSGLSNFANVFVNGQIQVENQDYTIEDTQYGRKISFIDYTLKSTDRIQVL